MGMGIGDEKIIWPGDREKPKSPNKKKGLDDREIGAISLSSAFPNPWSLIPSPDSLPLVIRLSVHKGVRHGLDERNCALRHCDITLQNAVEGVRLAVVGRRIVDILAHRIAIEV